MRYIGLIKKFLTQIIELLKTNVIKTVYFNFKMLPFKDAIKLPVFFYGKTCFRSLSGQMDINAPIQMGMIKIGITYIYVDHCIPENNWGIYGHLIFTGPLKVGRGSYIHIASKGTLYLGTANDSGGSWYGSHLTIICFDNIKIGNCVRITWDCQLYDTSFHYLELINNDGDIKPLTSPITIGDRVWIGNRSTISKGAFIPSDTIVASNSLVNKNWSSIDPYSMLVGQPAQPKVYGVKQIFDNNVQRELDNKFGYSRDKL